MPKNQTAIKGFCVKGKTYEIRDTLKEFGFQWNPDKKTWFVFHGMSDEAYEFIDTTQGVAIEPYESVDYVEITKDYLMENAWNNVDGRWNKIQLNALGLKFPPGAEWMDEVIGNILFGKKRKAFESQRAKYKSYT